MKTFHLTRCLAPLAVAVATLLASCATTTENQQTKLPNCNATFYVSPDGNDAWNGTQPAFKGQNNGPFKTLEKAQMAVRKHPLKGRETLIVAIRKGVYQLNQTWTFTPHDSGTEKAPVIWTAFPNERPLISGGRQIRNWKVTPQGTWVAKLPETVNAKQRKNAWDINQLFVNDARRPRARFPKQPQLFRMNGRPAPWKSRQEAKQFKGAYDELVCHQKDFQQCFLNSRGTYDRQEAPNAVLVLYNSWTASVHHLKDIMPDTCRLKLTKGPSWPVGFWEENGRYHIENLRSALTEPGEWYMDYNRGELHYIPMPGEKPENSTVIAPVLRTLLMLDGDAKAGLPVQHLVFRDLDFCHATFNHPYDQREDGQAAHKLRGAVRTIGAHHCTFQNLLVKHVGEYGFDLGRGSRHNRIVHSEITDMGGGGVRIGETTGDKPPVIECGFNTLENSFIHDGGLIAPAAVGAVIFRSSYNAIRHNEICDMFYSAISVGWSWGYANSTAHHNLVEYNRLHHLGYGLLSDMGAIYTLGVSPGTVIRGNTIHHVYAYSYGGWGLYPDEGSTGIVWEDNLVYQTKSGGFSQHYGRENIVRNNVLAFAEEGQVRVGRVEPHTSIIFYNNVVVFDNGQPYGSNITQANIQTRDNIYWDITQKPFAFLGIPFDEWQKDVGQEIGTRIVDPQFKDPANGDFTLPHDSPAAPYADAALKATKIAGLYGEKDWTQKPARITCKKNSPLAIPVPKIRPDIRTLKQIVVDFKDCKPGDKTPFAKTSGEDEKLGTSIRVTDELDGPNSKNALKFVDAPNQQFAWQPHMFFPIRWKKGVITGDFDVYLNSKDAILWHEWRSPESPYQVGPCLRFNGNGNLYCGNRKIHAIPLKTWIHVSITLTLKPGAPQQYTLTVTPQGGKAKTFKLDYLDPEWNTISAILFVSESEKKSDFYVANLKFHRKN